MPLFARVPRPIDVRYVDDPPWARRDGPRVAHNRVWMRADGSLPDDELLHVCVLTYASDLTLLDSVFARHGVAPHADRMLVASLDHALWFHRRREWPGLLESGVEAVTLAGEHHLDVPAGLPGDEPQRHQRSGPTSGCSTTSPRRPRRVAEV